jgi:hypothetical protein
MAACVTYIRDLAAGPVVARTSPAEGQLPKRPVLLASLRTRADLSRLPKDELIHAVAFFCDSPKDFVLLGRTISVGTPLAPLDEVEAKADRSGLYNYVVLLEVSRRGSPDSQPPEVGFDLMKTPRSVCIRLQGGYVAMHASSNTVRISAKRIREALMRYEESAGG